MQKHWEIKNEETVVDLGEYGEKLHPIAARMLASRGIKTPELIHQFLEPSWERDVHDPFLFTQMMQAVERLFLAIERQEHLVVHGDYDAAGVTASIVLASTIEMLVRAQGAEVASSAAETEDGSNKFLTILPKGGAHASLDIYIPHRERDGYGLNMEGVELIAARGTDLLITVDCGIANVAEIGAVREKGMDAIVVDHHQYGEELPDAILIHPRLPGETYPFKDLAAVGVAWKVAHALTLEAVKRGIEIPAGWEKWLLDLVSIATVTDIVPLIGENRTLETYGLKVLNKLRRPGFKALIEAAGWKKGELDSESIGFLIGPRINAAGRMEHAFIAVNLLLGEPGEELKRKANLLESINKSRQKATETLMKEAEHFTKNHEDYPLIFAWSENWSPSLVGLAAGRYVDRYGKPAIFVGKFGKQWIGSGRSIPTYNITEAVREAGEGLLTRYGGHAQACGFSLSADEHVAQFAEALRQHALASLQDHDLKPWLNIEAELSLTDINWKLVETLQVFQPFGEGNSKPIFMTRGLLATECALVGSAQNHVRCTLRDLQGNAQKFIGFYRSDLLEVFQSGSPIDVVYEIGISEWNGRKEIQCKLIDARTS